MANRNSNAKSVKLSAPAAVLLAIAVMLLAMGNSEAMAEKCKTVKGHWISQTTFTEGCTSLIGLCVNGKSIGGLKGDFVVTATSLTPSIDTPATAVVFLTSDLLLHTKDGDLEMKEAAAYNTSGSGDLGDVVTIVGGTGKWDGATGRLRVAGTLPFVEPSDVDFEGEVCLPRNIAEEDR